MAQLHQPLTQTQRSASSGAHNATSIAQRVCLVQRFALFARLTPSDCANIVAMGHERDFSRRETLFFEGDTVERVLLLMYGCAKVTQFGADGSEVILRLAGPGEIVDAFGSWGGKHGSTAQALQPTRALVWDAATFEAASDRFPILRRNIASVLCQRLQEMEERFREISTQKVAPRLSSQLVRLVSQVGRRVDGAIEISLSQEELAQLTGTTLFTVSRVLSYWDQLGIVSTRREAVLVRDLKALSGLAGV
jgi:CRP-like cAMP-binding protein